MDIFCPRVPVAKYSLLILCKKIFFPLYFFTMYLKIFCIISVFLLLGSKMNKQMGIDRNN